MPACTLAFSSLCLQNALMLLKSAEVTPVHEPESVLESQMSKEDDLLNQETDASRYHWVLQHSQILLKDVTFCRVVFYLWNVHGWHKQLLTWTPFGTEYQWWNFENSLCSQLIFALLFSLKQSANWCQKKTLWDIVKLQFKPILRSHPWGMAKWPLNTGLTSQKSKCKWPLNGGWPFNVGSLNTGLIISKLEATCQKMQKKKIDFNNYCHRGPLSPSILFVTTVRPEIWWTLDVCNI